MILTGDWWRLSTTIVIPGSGVLRSRSRSAGLRSLRRLQVSVALQGNGDGEVAQQLVLTLGMSGGESRVAAEELIQEVAQHHLRSRGMMLAVGVALWGSDDLPLIRKLQNGEHPNGVSGAQWKAVLTNWKRGIDYPKSMSPDHRRLVRDGEVHYFRSCVSCHGPDGNGVMVPGTDVRLAPAPY